MRNNDEENKDNPMLDNGNLADKADVVNAQMEVAFPNAGAAGSTITINAAAGDNIVFPGGNFYDALWLGAKNIVLGGPVGKFNLGNQDVVFAGGKNAAIAIGNPNVIPLRGVRTAVYFDDESKDFTTEVTNKLAIDAERILKVERDWESKDTPTFTVTRDTEIEGQLGAWELNNRCASITVRHSLNFNLRASVSKLLLSATAEDIEIGLTADSMFIPKIITIFRGHVLRIGDYKITCKLKNMTVENKDILGFVDEHAYETFVSFAENPSIKGYKKQSELFNSFVRVPVLKALFEATFGEGVFESMEVFHNAHLAMSCPILKNTSLADDVGDIVTWYLEGMQLAGEGDGHNADVADLS